MADIELSDVEERVYAALAAVEERVGEAGIDEVASEAGLDRDTTAGALSALSQDDRDLVRQLPGGDTDIGPRYRVKDTAG